MASKPTTDPREAQARKLVCCDLKRLAPKLSIVAREWTAEANAQGLDLEAYETTRSEELGALYFALGRTKAPTVWRSWHAYGLALDCISHTRQWAVWPEWIWTDAQHGIGEWRGGDPKWYEPVVALAKAHGLHWGGDWRTFKDCPHFQHHCEGMLETPSAHAKELYDEGGVEAVWQEVGAL